jgi:hypothetical protein
MPGAEVSESFACALPDHPYDHYSHCYPKNETAAGSTEYPDQLRIGGAGRVERRGHCASNLIEPLTGIVERFPIGLARGSRQRGMSTAVGFQASGAA